MESKFGIKQIVGIFLGCVAFYLAAFYGIEHLRHRQGPWQIEFCSSNNPPAIYITQPHLGIERLCLEFPGTPTSTNTAATFSFADARPVPFELPLGECIFLDTTTLPGNVTMKIAGHTIQLLPRVLTIDGKEQSWRAQSRLSYPFVSK